jgi:hypothetical protein
MKKESILLCSTTCVGVLSHFHFFNHTDALHIACPTHFGGPLGDGRLSARALRRRRSSRNRRLHKRIQLAGRAHSRCHMHSQVRCGSKTSSCLAIDRRRAILSLRHPTSLFLFSQMQTDAVAAHTTSRENMDGNEAQLRGTALSFKRHWR